MEISPIGLYEILLGDATSSKEPMNLESVVWKEDNQTVNGTVYTYMSPIYGVPISNDNVSNDLQKGALYMIVSKIPSNYQLPETLRKDACAAVLSLQDRGILTSSNYSLCNDLLRPSGGGGDNPPNPGPIPPHPE